MSEEIATADGQAREPVSFLVFSASLREGSLNTQLADLAAGAIESNGGKVVSGTMAEFDCPSYDADVQREQGFPPGAEELRRRLEASDAFVISSPEYNASMPGALKNTVDWVSRFHPQPFHERHALLLSASPSMSAATEAFGLCASPSSTSALASIPTCSRSRAPTSPWTTKVKSPTRSFDDASR
jgi:multimeric flavodoxin WrbA